MVGLPNVLQYDATHPLYGVAFSHSTQHPNRIALTSYLAGPTNKLFVVDAPSSGASLSSSQRYSPSVDFQQLSIANLAYPATKVGWEPAESLAGARHEGQGGRGELLATTGDVLRIWELKSFDGGESNRIGYGRNGYNESAREQYQLQERSVLSNSKQPVYNLPPITSFSWNPTAPASIVTCSTDTTATLWDINTSQALTQLIAHDRAVYDLSWLPQSADIFVSVGADGSLRAFDLRQLEHSTILYETPNSSPLARIAFSNKEQHMLACFSMDDSRTLILDMRSPGQPVAELMGHSAPLGAISWGSGGTGSGATGGGWIASGGDDSQILLYDLTQPLPAEPERARASSTNHALSPSVTPSAGGSPSPTPARSLEIQPVRAWTAHMEINNLTFSHSGETIASVSGHRLSVLQL